MRLGVVNFGERFVELLPRLRVQGIEAVAIQLLPVGGRYADQKIEKFGRVTVECAWGALQGRLDETAQTA